jgi:adenylate cyclase class 2
MNSSPSPVETEIKIRWGASAAEARHRIEEKGYRLIEPRTLESDQLYDFPKGTLMAEGKLIRLRRTSPGQAGPAPDVPGKAARNTVTYKGPGMSQRYKSREEIEFDVSDADAFAEVLDRLGYQPRFFYQKYRTKFAAPGEPGMVTLDETPMGVFLELEGPEYWIDATALRLGYASSAYVTASYFSLYREYRLQNGDAPVNMVFEKEQPTSTEEKGP